MMRRTLSRLGILILALGLIGYGANSVLAQAPSPTISISRTNGPTGISITVTGSGFAANETGITVNYDGTAVASGISASPTGGWSATFTVPASAAGAHIIDAYGATTSPANVPDITFTVTPSISISRTSGTPGSSVTVIGSGFAVSETGVTVTFDGTAVASGISANTQGGWSVTFTVPASAPGSHTIDVYGATTSAASVPDITFTITSGISINRTTGPPGSSIIVTGSGFAVSESGITVTYDGTPVASGISANAQGGWSATFTVPASPSGAHIIDAYGATTASANIPDITFTVTPNLSINRTIGPPGTSVTVTGSGFTAGETGITVTYDGNPVASGISANSQGGWSATFTIPPSTAGSRTIDAYGSITPAAIVPDMTFTIGPGISINRTTGPSGSSITATGAGFGAGETGITVTYDGNPVASGISANSQGVWSATFTVPASASGAHTLDAYGTTTSSAVLSKITFMVTPTISINRTTGPPGSSITATGSGFSASETSITITYDGTPVASGISANSQGGWSAAFTVPASASGLHSIRASGSATQATSVGEVGFNITSGISISPASGYVGATVEIAGSGFAASSPLRFTYDDKEIPTEGVTTDASGSFSKSITIPKSPAGSHTIKVVDSQKNESKAPFTMESTPPPVPRPLSPEDGARIGIVGSVRPTLKWSSVTDSSGVTYILQLDTSPDFSQPILQKTDMSGTQYTLTVADALPQGEYYWRVKAIDGAGNQSAWSQSQLLKSGLMPLWTLLAIIAFAVVMVVGGVSFFAVRSRAARRREAITIPEVEMPPVIPAQWRLIQPEEAAKERALPFRLALPQPAKGAKTLSTEEQARLKAIVDFAQSLPLVEPGYSADWLIDLAESSMGTEVSAPVYEQLLKGELQVRYEPAWMRHPTYQDLTTLLEGQPILQELNAFMDAVASCAAEAILLLQEVYRDAIAEIPSDLLEKGGWGFISAVYSDAISWFLGKSLREPSERDYAIKSGGPGEEAEALWLWGVEATPFAAPLIQAIDDKHALRLRALHLRLRRTYRNSNRARQVAGMITQLEVQRNRLLNVLSQFGRFKQ